MPTPSPPRPPGRSGALPATPGSALCPSSGRRHPPSGNAARSSTRLASAELNPWGSARSPLALPNPSMAAIAGAASGRFPVHREHPRLDHKESRVASQDLLGELLEPGKDGGESERVDVVEARTPRSARRPRQTCRPRPRGEWRHRRVRGLDAIHMPGGAAFAPSRALALPTPDAAVERRRGETGTTRSVRRAREKEIRAADRFESLRGVLHLRHRVTQRPGKPAQHRAAEHELLSLRIVPARTSSTRKSTTWRLEAPNLLTKSCRSTAPSSDSAAR